MAAGPPRPAPHPRRHPLPRRAGFRDRDPGPGADPIRVRLCAAFEQVPRTQAPRRHRPSRRSPGRGPPLQDPPRRPWPGRRRRPRRHPGTDAVAALTAWTQIRPGRARCAVHLDQPRSAAIRQPITGVTISRIVRRRVLAAGLRDLSISGQSFRAGHATPPRTARPSTGWAPRPGTVPWRP